MQTYEKPFDLGVIVGRFQVLHKGHGDIIRKALQLCKETAIFVGSSQESGTLKNPFSYEIRKELLLTAFPELSVYPLPDIGVGNTYAWGDYVLQNICEHCGRYPELFVSGRESRRTSWIDESWNIGELFIPKTIDISATKMIRFVIEDDQKSWETYIEPALTDRYFLFRENILASKDNLETKSI